YYALIKAETEERAIAKYVELVADDDGELKDDIKEVSREHALKIYSNTKSEDGEPVSTFETIETFNSPEETVLAVTSELL
ncbi:hypothetical protein, partial [Bacillus altitudinis]|uniref:hypothetical protein n=1 Tax=Bacillus altitudinis TaxID=293387 RepID=UPI00366D8E70